MSNSIVFQFCLPLSVLTVTFSSQCDHCGPCRAWFLLRIVTLYWTWYFSSLQQAHLYELYCNRYIHVHMYLSFAAWRGHAVAQLVEALRYKFDSRWCHWNFPMA